MITDDTRDSLSEDPDLSFPWRYLRLCKYRVVDIELQICVDMCRYQVDIEILYRIVNLGGQDVGGEVCRTEAQ